MLTITSAPRSLVAENWPRVLETQRQGLLLVVIAIETADRGSIFRSQAVIAVMQVKGVEILPRFLSEAGQKEITALQYRRVNGGIARRGQKCLHALRQPVLLLIRLRQKIIHATQPLYPLSHNSLNPLFFFCLFVCFPAHNHRTRALIGKEFA